MSDSLPALQRQFADYLFGAADGIARAVNDSPRTDRATLLGVYRDAYVLRLVEILAKDFPKTKAMLGDEAFDAMGRAYLRAHPSQSFTVRWFGRHLSLFLRDAAPWND